MDETLLPPGMEVSTSGNIDTTPPPKRETTLDEAKRLVYGERGEAYRHPLDDYTTTAALWSAILRHPVTAEQAILCMIAVKISRESRVHKRDSIVDIAGYAECLQMVHDEREARKREGQANAPVSTNNVVPSVVADVPAAAPKSEFREWLINESRLAEGKA